MFESSFTDLRCKQVINVVDGRCLGHIIDTVFEICSGRILGIVVPGNKSFFTFFKGCDDIFIPYHNICKIGEDVILVELFPMPLKNMNPKFCSTDAKNTEKVRVKGKMITPDAYSEIVDREKFIN